MKFLVLCTVAITSVCYGAAHQTSSSSAQAKAIFEITHHSMPHQIATKGDLTCIIADPTLLHKLPKTFAKQILTNMGENQDAATFKSVLATAHEKHLPTDDVATGISSVKMALLIVSNPGVINITWQPQTIASSKKIRLSSYLTLTRTGRTIRSSCTPAHAYVKPEEADASRLEEFGKQEHIRILLKRGETGKVATLAADFLKKLPINADLTLKITPTPDTAPCCLL